MRILAIHRYYWPDTPPYASMLRAIAETLVASGHEVTVFTTQPSYKPGFRIPRQRRDEMLNGVRVRRMGLLPEMKKNMLLRVLNLALFMAGIMAHTVFRRRYDVIMASTAPAVMVGLDARWVARLTGARFVYHCQDIHPELGRLSGHFRNQLVYQSLLGIDSANCNAAVAVVVLSTDMRAAIQARMGYIGKDNIHVINNFSLPVFPGAVAYGTQPKLAEELLPPSDRMRMIFAGNIGRFQGLDVILDAFQTAKHRAAMELVFLGEGSELDRLQDKVTAAKLRDVRFIPHQPVDVAKALIERCDLCLVSLIPHIYKYAYPSKTMTCLELGKPILAIVEPDSELARFVTDNEIGYAASLEDVGSIARTMDMAWEHRAALSVMASNASRIWAETYSPESVLPRWAELFGRIQGNARNV